ncbi:MAG: hypothetical protein WBN04_08655 [Paracoccaceae bacterium]
MKFGISKKQSLGILGVSAIALLALHPVAPFGIGAGLIAGAAHAESHGDDGDSHGGGSKGGKGGKGGSGDDHSHDDSTTDDHGHSDGETSDHDHADGGSGKGGKDGQGAGKGGNGQGASGGKGGSGNRPIWAKEGLPEVELGRLNVVRAPGRVLDRAYAETLSEFTAERAAFYSLPLNEALEKLRTEFRAIDMVDSPLQNLALLRDALDGTSVLSDKVTNSNETLMAMFLGTASDKTIPISPETAYSVARMLGYELSEDAAASLATDAEAVRQAVLEGHG